MTSRWEEERRGVYTKERERGSSRLRGREKTKETHGKWATISILLLLRAQTSLKITTITEIARIPKVRCSKIKTRMESTLTSTHFFHVIPPLSPSKIPIHPFIHSHLRSFQLKSSLSLSISSNRISIALFQSEFVIVMREIGITRTLEINNDSIQSLWCIYLQAEPCFQWRMTFSEDFRQVWRDFSRLLVSKIVINNGDYPSSERHLFDEWGSSPQRRNSLLSKRGINRFRWEDLNQISLKGKAFPDHSVRK